MKRLKMILFLLFVFPIIGHAGQQLVSPVTFNVAQPCVIPITGYEALNPLATAYKTRVEADSGTIVDIQAVSDAFDDAENNGYLSDIVAAYDPNWGIKTGVQGATKLYSLTGADYDLAQGTQSKEPLINLSSINGKNTLEYGPTKKHLIKLFALTQPEIVIALVKPNSYLVNSSYWEGSTINKMSLYNFGPTEALYNYAGNFAPINYFLRPNEWKIITDVYNGASSSIQVNEVQAVTGNSGTLDADGFTLGGSTTSADCDIGATYILNTTTPTKHDAVRNFINSQYAVYGSENLIIFDGDSLTWGVEATFGNAYPSATMAGISGDWDFYNLGIIGYSAYILKEYASAKIDPLYNSSVDENIVVVWGGTNDMLAGATGAGAYAYLKEYCQGRVTAGFKVVALTCLTRTDAGIPADFETQRATFNNLVLTDLVNESGVTIVDVASNTNLDDSTDTTYFSTDLVHLIDAGYAVVAGLVKTAIETVVD